MLHKMPVADFDVVLRVHTRGTFLGIREAARRMIESATRGSIINVTSSAGLQGTIGQINYSAAKGAITSMTKSAAKELARHGVRVNAVAPVAATPMTEKLMTEQADKIQPAALTTDEQFIRRVTLDLTGELPAPAGRAR